MVLPLALLLTFGMIEITGLHNVRNAMTGAILAGSREASIRSAVDSDIKGEMLKVLRRFGVNNPKITISPSPVDRNTQEIDISLEINAGSGNGFFFSDFFIPALSSEITVQRL